MGLVFLTVPITIREQIYQDLLTYSPSRPSPSETASSSTICRLLTLNRQLYDEITQYMKSRLCVLINTNDPQFIQDILEDKDERLPLISQLQSLDETVKKDVTRAAVALELDFYIFQHDLEATSSAAFLIPASSIKTLLSMLWLPSWSIWCMQASLTFILLNTFTHTQESAEKALIQPWIKWFVPSHFVGINTSINITPALTTQLNDRLLGDYNAHGHLKKLNSFFRGFGADLSQSVRQHHMACRYARVIWDCHFECIQAAAGDTIGNDTVLALWGMSCRNAANLVQILLNLAMDVEQGAEVAVASGDEEKFKEARSVAEQWIGLLRDKPTWAHTRIGEMENVKKSIRKHKALMCFRVHNVCKGLGDVDAVIAYLVDAIMYEPESEEKLVKRIEELEGEQASIVEGNVSAAVAWAD